MGSGVGERRREWGGEKEKGSGGEGEEKESGVNLSSITCSLFRILRFYGSIYRIQVLQKVFDVYSSVMTGTKSSSLVLCNGQNITCAHQSQMPSDAGLSK